MTKDEELSDHKAPGASRARGTCWECGAPAVGRGLINWGSDVTSSPISDQAFLDEDVGYYCRDHRPFETPWIPEP